MSSKPPKGKARSAKHVSTDYIAHTPADSRVVTVDGAVAAKASVKAARRVKPQRTLRLLLDDHGAKAASKSSQTGVCSQTTPQPMQSTFREKETGSKFLFRLKDLSGQKYACYGDHKYKPRRSSGHHRRPEFNSAVQNHTRVSSEF